MPTRVKTPNPEIFAKAVRGALAGNKQLSNSITKLLIGIIRGGKLPSGKGIKPLAPTTIQRRRDLSKKNRTHPDFSPRKSNLTFTGQFLDSFKATFERVGRKVLINIAPTGVHKALINLNGKRQRGVRNDTIGEGLVKSGRDYRPVSKQNTRKITKLVITALKKKLKL